VEVLDQTPKLVLAGDHADVAMIESLAQQGCTVLVLSAETCGRLPGYRVEQGADCFYSGTRAGAGDHPLFWGVAGASFLPLEQTPARGALAAMPTDARVLLGGHCRGISPFRNDWSVDIGFYGLETREPAPPLAVQQLIGSGEIIATTIEPWDRKSETHRQLLVNLLANAGVAVPPARRGATVEVKSTVPLCFDGNLDDWTNDTDDINISMYSHAQPIALTSRDAVAGRPTNDLGLSGIAYLLYDRDNLYVGGIIIANESGCCLEVTVGEHVLTIRPDQQQVELDGACAKLAQAAFARQPADTVIDARLLSLVEINKQVQKSEARYETPGHTFELGLPWQMLGLAKPPERLTGRVRLLGGDGLVLQQPAASEDDQARLELLLRDANIAHV
ncbi:MAG: hypothetical protein LC725_10460, partial [Lentisphaerae bacterium]|nr:hypothetical protein [Lentisphaerota bacterium]